MTAKITDEAARRLRERADERLKIDEGMTQQPLTPMETEQLIHELRLRQIELEMQNEELHRVILSDISDLKLAEVALSQSEEHFRSFVENANDVLFSISPKGVFTYVSPNWKDAFGYELHETIGKPFVSFVHPDDASNCFASFRALMTTGEKQQNIKYRVLHKNGRYIWYSANASQWKEPISGEAAYLGIGRDITERKQSEEQLHRLNRSLMAVSDCNLALFDARDEAELLNDICRIAVEIGGYRMAWAGYTDRESKGVRPAGQFGFEDGYLDTIQITWPQKEYEDSPGLTAIRNAQVCLVRDIETDPIFAPWRVEAGKRGYSSMVALPLKIDDQIFGVLSIYSASVNAFDAEEIDLLTRFADNLSFGIKTMRTRKALLEMEKAAQEAREYAEQLRAEAERKKSEVRESVLQIITDSAKDAILMMNPDGAVTFWNPAATKIWGYLPDEVLGKHLHNLLVPGRYQEGYKSAFPRFIRTGYGDAVGKSLELFALHKDGREIAVDMSLSSVFLDGGWHAVGIVRDITEKKSVMEQLIHSQKIDSIGQLAGGLAHDLNNILTVVNGYATLARQRMEKDETQDNYLHEIVKASLSASALTHSLLVYSRKQEMHQQKQNLNRLITTVGSFIERIIHDNIEFTLDLQEEPLGVYVDDGQIEQVLLNLSTNARDAMSNGGTFSIATAAGEMDEEYIATHGFGKIGRYAVITVTDSGHGMDTETKRKIFDPFFTTKDVGKGTGRGLSMVMGIIKQHDGFIELQSEPGSGSVFKLYLPLLAPPEVISTVPEQDIRMESGSGTILLAEDDTPALTLLKELLTRAGYDVITAVDGEDAVKKFVAYQDEIQLVISDIVMPKMSGTQARDKIREISGGMKFIFVSGHSSDVIEREGVLDADAEVIMKPIMPFELLEKIREVIG